MTQRLLAVAAFAGFLILAPPLPVAAGAERTTHLAWDPCDGAETPGMECTTVKAPLDYDHPHAATVRLAVIRHRATDPAHRVGTLFFNPGGPGGGGTAFLPGLFALDLFPAEIAARFDVVSWDPRGVGDSTAVQCFASQHREKGSLARLPAGFPVGAGEKRRWIRLFRRFGARCADRNGSLLRHLSTADTARDLNRLRHVIGAARLNFLGISYGTFLGGTYANLFPNRVRALVLDGNLNPRSWMHRRPRLDHDRFLGTELRLRTDRGSARTLEAFVNLCGQTDTRGCPFSAGTAAATRAKFAALLRQLRHHARGEPGYAAIVAEIANELDTVRPIGASPGWTELAETLQEAWSGADPRGPSAGVSVRRLAGSSPFPSGASRRTRASRKYAGPEQQYAIYCSESPNPSPAAFRSLSRIGFDRSGALGRYWSWVPEPCGSWPAQAADRYRGPWDRRTPNPLLVIGNAHDPSTPYRESRAMVRQLARARLLTVAGYGHSQLLNPSSCARRYETRYLIGLDMPPAGTRRPQDYEPFTGSP